MKNKLVHYRILICVQALVATAHGVIPFNLFEPWDVLIKPQRPSNRLVDILVGYEGVVHARGFLDDDDCETVSSKGNVLQLWQKKQDAIAAFKGFPAESAISQQAQFLNIDDDNRTHGYYIPCGKLNAQNLMFGVQFRAPLDITLAAYIPYRIASLTDVSWTQENDNNLFEDQISPDFISTIEKLGCMNLRGWHRHGFGDLMLQAQYYFHYPQPKKYLRNVAMELRGGLLIPTGLKPDINKLLAFPFGFDGGTGLLAAFRLELWFVHYLRFAIDVELMHLFGNTMCRRVKTNSAQTDLLLLGKTTVFKEPGLRQHYTLYADLIDCKGFNGRVAYQYTSVQENKYFMCAEGFNPRIINCAESLQESTAHQLVFSAGYTWYRPACMPSLMFFGKYAFNGKRVILGDTVGMTFTIAF